MANKNPKSNQAQNADQKIVEPNTYLETEKEHKKWYSSEGMGKTRGKPVSHIPAKKKDKGTKKHSLRKEKGK